MAIVSRTAWWLPSALDCHISEPAASILAVAFVIPAL